VARAGLKPLDDVEAQRAPDNVNQLYITIVECRDVLSRRKGIWRASNGVCNR